MSKVKLCYFLQHVHNSRFRNYQKLPPLLIAAVLDYLAKFWSTTLDLEILLIAAVLDYLADVI